MRKSTLLKLALVLMAIIMTTGAYAQYPAAIATNYVEVADSTYQTVNKSFVLYVAPDPVYSPSYTASPIAANINTNSRWTWTYTGLTGSPVSGVISAANDNFVTFTAVPVGAHSVSVVESNSLTGCADGTPIVHGIRVIAAPTAVIAGSATNPNYTWDNFATNSYRACVPGTTGTETVNVTITESAFLPAAYRSYAFGVSGVVENLQSDLSTPVVGGPLSTPSFEYTVADKLKSTTVLGTHTWTPNDFGVATSTLSFATPTLAVLNNLPTRYTFTLVKASDLAAGDGIVSGVSHKSDFVGGTVIGHPFGTDITLSYIVLPAPVTGPIYHIPNAFRY